MKKRFLSILLTLSMVVGLVPMTLSTAVAGEPAQPEAQQIDRTGWIKIPSGELVDEYKTIDTSGKYYLDGDVTGNISISSETEVTIDLNGHVLQGDSECRDAVIANYGQLTVTDNNPTITHKYVVDESGLWVWNDAATGEATPYGELTARPAEGTVISVPGGCITGGAVTTGDGYDGVGGGISTSYSSTYTGLVTLDVNNVNIIGNSAENGGGIGHINGNSVFSHVWYADNIRVMGNVSSTYGGGIYCNDFVSTSIANSTIIMNTANSCGGGISSGASTIIDRCIISYNESRVASTDSTIGGGGIYHNDAADLVVSRSEICNNISASNGGGILVLFKSAFVVMKDTVIKNNTAGNLGGGVYFNKAEECFAAGTLVTMADGNTKRIEEVDEGDVVKTFDHESGEISSAEVYLAYKGEEKAVPFTLNFDDGKKLSIVGVHDLLAKSSLSYVSVSDSNAESFVGEEFYGEDGAWHKLASITKETTAVDYYSIYTAGHQNCFASGLLSCPDDMDYILKIYELDENLKADEEQLKSDIETYGLSSFESLNERYGVSRDWFDAVNSKYLKIAIGKGIVTVEDIENLYSTVEEEGWDYDSAPMMAAAPALTYAAAPTLTYAAAPMMASAGSDLITYDNYLTVFSDSNTFFCNIASGTKIFDNTDSYTASNLWLGNETCACLYGDQYSDIFVGITLQKGLGNFTENGESIDTKYFFSDNESYGVDYNNEYEYLEIVEIDYSTTPKMNYSAKLTLSKNFDIGLGVRKAEESTAAIDPDKLDVYADGEKVSLDEELNGVMAKVAPKNVGTPINVSVVYDGVIIKGFTYSVKKYCDAAFEAYAGDTEKYAKLNTLCEAILNYGKYAEDYANGTTTSTVNVGHEIDPATITVPESTAEFTPNALYGGQDSYATIMPDSTLKLTYILNSSFAYDNSSTKTQNFFILNQDNKQIDPSKVSVSCDEQSGTATIVIELYAYQLANEYTLKVKGVDASSFTLSYGVYDYCSDITGGDFDATLISLCKMIYNYSEAAQAYVG